MASPTLPTGILGACVAMGLVGGCAGNQGEARAIEPAVRAPTVSHGESGWRGPDLDFSSAVQIRYDSRLHPEPLTYVQLDDILRNANSACPSGQEVWFVWVQSNYRADDGTPVCGATVYYTPELREPRLRKGHCLSLGTRGLMISGEGRDYWQVSLREQPFGSELFIPEGALLPISPPKDFTETEVIEIIDFVRTNPSSPSKPHEIPIPGSFDGSKPIYSIKRQSDLIEVQSGTVQGPLAGAGEFILLRKADQGFEVVSIGTWVT